MGSRRSVRGAQEETPDEDVQDVRPTSPPSPIQPHTAPVGSTLSRAFGSIGSLTRRGWGEAPTYLEAMSSPDFRDVEAQAGVPPPRTATPMASGFRELLSRAGGSFRAPTRQRPMAERPGSQISLLLQPQTSRLSTQTSNTSSTSPWASTHSLTISSPVPNTALRASFDIPRAGLSDDQMRYISTPAAVNLVGVKLGEPPAGRRRRRSEATQSGEGQETLGGAPPPSWEQLDEERRRHEADDRRGLARPVSQEDIASGEAAQHEGESGTSEAERTPSTTVQPASPPTLGISMAPTAPTVEIEPPTPISTTFGASAIR